MYTKKFLDRIGFTGEVKINLETLAALQERFLLSVVFENLDIHYGPVHIPMDPSAAYEKIVNQGRGGLCYECNGLFHAMLRRIGFQVDMLSCFLVGEPCAETDFGHMLLRVSLNHDYYVDVGNGRSFRTPLRADGSNESRLPEGYTYRIGPHIEGQTIYLKKDGDLPWTTRYHFNTVPRELRQYETRSWFYQNTPNTHFTKGPLATLATPDGRLTLTEKEFTETRNCVDTVTPIADEDAFFTCLRERFAYPVEKIPRDKRRVF